MVTHKKSFAKLATDSGVRSEDFNNVENGGGSAKCLRFWALLEVCKVASEKYTKEKELQTEKAQKERKEPRAVEGKATLMSEESMEGAGETRRKSTGKRIYREDPEGELETSASTELEDVNEMGFVGMWSLSLSSWSSSSSLSSSRKKQRCCKNADEEANKFSNKDDDPEWNLETPEGLGFAGKSLSRKKWSYREKSDKKKCLMNDDDPEWDSERCACSGMEDAKGLGFAEMSASLPSSSRKKAQNPRKKSDNNANKRCAKDGRDRHDMPLVLKNHITRVLGGREMRLVIQKHLTPSDVNKSLCRVTIPMNQIIDSGFLREDEKELLDMSDEKDVRVLCYRSPEENIGERVLKLRLWVMHKKPEGQRATDGEEIEPLETRAGGEDNPCGEEEARALKKGKLGGTDSGKGPRPSRMYILRTGWTKFVEENMLQDDNLVQIWSFRVDSQLAPDELRLALIVLASNKQEGIGE